MELRLLVIRTPEPQALARFYTLLGVELEYHSHNGSPMHYSGSINKTVIEIYPLAKKQQYPDTYLRLGFSIENFDTTIEKLRQLGIPVLKDPMQTDFGFMTVVEDPDGRKVELYKNTRI